MTKTIKQNETTKNKTNKNVQMDNGTSGFKRALNFLSRVGKALLFPIAMLPIAAILLRIGAAVPADTDFSSFIAKILLTGGNTVFDQLPIIFAIGVGFGLSKDNRGEAAISAFVAMTLLSIMLSSKNGSWFGGVDISNTFYGGLDLGGDQSGFHGVFGGKYNDIMAKNVLNGIIIGGLTAFIYNRFNGVEMPKILGFFSGRRLVPVLVIMSALVFSLFYALVWPWAGYVLSKLSESLTEATGDRYSNAAIMGVYAVLNRLLLPFGLHHIPNSMFWFQLGDFVKPDGTIAHGDINGFLQASAVQPGGAALTAGTFQTGFFPMMMFGLPAMVGAIWFTAEKEQRTKVIGLLGGSAIVSFFTGITEPIEFAFLFAAPALFGLHIILSGVSAFITGLFGIQLGFGFSAGLIDYVLSIPKSTEIITAHGNDPSGAWSSIEQTMANPAWVIVIGLFTGAAYFFGGTFAIKKFNISTPGRGENLIEDDIDSSASSSSTKTSSKASTSSNAKTTARAAKYVKALGGYENIKEFSHCATRLRYDVKDVSKVSEAELKAAGAFGLKKVSKTHVQVIVGPNVEIVNNEILAGKPKK